MGNDWKTSTSFKQYHTLAWHHNCINFIFKLLYTNKILIGFLSVHEKQLKCQKSQIQSSNNLKLKIYLTSAHIKRQQII
ncbi:unnamed protein product [Paramecium octaurelia]|uniref:Uncharacterized protein n=1 Tax=Paramecium octaurelia TaxID=43137 RepID=A0A8S1W785_PAROT|nr:unnamed protein product [Paramecium octaurelia]